MHVISIYNNKGGVGKSTQGAPRYNLTVSWYNNLSAWSYTSTEASHGANKNSNRPSLSLS